MPKNKENEETRNELTADDLALLAAVLVIIADTVALWSVLVARNEKNGDDSGGAVAPLAAVISQYIGKPSRMRQSLNAAAGGSGIRRQAIRYQTVKASNSRKRGLGNASGGRRPGMRGQTGLTSGLRKRPRQ